MASFSRSTADGMRLVKPTGPDVYEIIADKWEKMPAQTSIRCWLKAKILPEEHTKNLMVNDARPDRGGADDSVVLSRISAS